MFCAWLVFERVSFVCQDSDDSEGSVGEQMQKLERLVQRRRHPKTTVDASQEQKPTAADNVAGSSPEDGEKTADSRPGDVEKVVDSSPDARDGEKMSDSSPSMESFEFISGKQESEKCSVPDGTPVTETIGLMEATSPNEDASRDYVAACCTRLMTDAGQGSGDIDLDASEGAVGTEEMIPGCEAGESGDHSELRKRASAVTGDDGK